MIDPNTLVKQRFAALQSVLTEVFKENPAQLVAVVQASLSAVSNEAYKQASVNLAAITSIAVASAQNGAIDALRSEEINLALMAVLDAVALAAPADQHDAVAICVGSYLSDAEGAQPIIVGPFLGECLPKFTVQNGKTGESHLFTLTDSLTLPDETPSTPS